MEYDFVEIGTCDFWTLTKNKPQETGICVEPLSEYLDNLPDNPNHIKLCAAISDHDGHMTIFYVPTKLIRDLELPSWMRGASSIGTPNKTVVRWLQRHGWPEELIHERIVPTYSFPTLCDLYSIRSIKYLKVDTEGHDFYILCSLEDAITAGKLAPPEQIKIEASRWGGDVRQRMYQKLVDLGYTVRRTDTDFYGTLSKSSTR